MQCGQVARQPPLPQVQRGITRQLCEEGIADCGAPGRGGSLTGAHLALATGSRCLTKDSGKSQDFHFGAGKPVLQAIFKVESLSPRPLVPDNNLSPTGLVGELGTAGCVQAQPGPQGLLISQCECSQPCHVMDVTPSDA